ncbi:MAG: ChaN family lipoprotein [Steroidobacteraceae bacterium]
MNDSRKGSQRKCNRARQCLALAGALLLAGLAMAREPVYQMRLGDPDRAQRLAPVQLDGITASDSGESLSPAGLARSLANARILFIGEEHTNFEFHRVQLEVIRALHEAGREVLIGLEMFRYTDQAMLDRWNAGEIALADFPSESKWYEVWSHQWGYYRDIFAYARDQHIPMYGINVPREVVRTVRAKGFAALESEAQQHMPPHIDITSADHRKLFRAYFDEDDALHSQMSPEALEGMYQAQTTWDGAMAWNAMKALQAHGGKDAIMVVFIGSGHVAFGLGSVRQIRPHFKERIATLIPVWVREEDGTPVASVRASYADYVWGVPPTAGPGLPELGVSLMGSVGKEPTKLIRVDRNSSAAAAGLKVGDILRKLGGQTIDSNAALQRVCADYRWGEAVPVVIERGGETRTLELVFRRPTPAAH